MFPIPQLKAHYLKLTTLLHALTRECLHPLGLLAAAAEGSSCSYKQKPFIAP